MLPHTGFVYYSQIVQDTNPVSQNDVFFFALLLVFESSNLPEKICL